MTETIKIVKREIFIRPCVEERRNWKKFGVVEGIERGKHRQGDFMVAHEVKIETLDSQHKEEIEIVQTLRTNINTEAIR